MDLWGAQSWALSRSQNAKRVWVQGHRSSQLQEHNACGDLGVGMGTGLQGVGVMEVQGQRQQEVGTK